MGLGVRGKGRGRRLGAMKLPGVSEGLGVRGKGRARGRRLGAMKCTDEDPRLGVITR